MIILFNIIIGISLIFLIVLVSFFVFKIFKLKSWYMNDLLNKDKEFKDIYINVFNDTNLSLFNNKDYLLLTDIILKDNNLILSYDELIKISKETKFKNIKALENEFNNLIISKVNDIDSECPLNYLCEKVIKEVNLLEKFAFYVNNSFLSRNEYKKYKKDFINKIRVYSYIISSLNYDKNSYLNIRKLYKKWNKKIKYAF